MKLKPNRKMKKNISVLMAVAAITFIFSSFISINEKQESYNVDVSKSTIAWRAEKVTGFHTGNVTIKSGTVTTEKGAIVGGTFDIDMTSISCTDLKGSMNEKLVGHLKSDDFFGVEKFPTAKLVIKSVSGKQVKADLTIKGKTNEITFMVNSNIDENSVKADSKIDVDRTKYDVRYGSNSFFDNLGDKVIYDVFTLDVNLVASK